jgi:hypothetical protein
LRTLHRCRPNLFPAHPVDKGEQLGIVQLHCRRRDPGPAKLLLLERFRKQANTAAVRLNGLGGTTAPRAVTAIPPICGSTTSPAGDGTSADGGSTPGSDHGGCGCAIPARRPSWSALAAGLMLLLGLVGGRYSL